MQQCFLFTSNLKGDLLLDSTVYLLHKLIQNTIKNRTEGQNLFRLTCTLRCIGYKYYLKEQSR